MRLLLFSLVVVIASAILLSTASFSFAEDIEQIARDNLNIQPTEKSPSAENFPSLDDMSEEEIIKFLSSQQHHHQQQQGNDIIIDADDYQQQQAHELHHHQQGGVNTNDAALTLDDGVTPKQKVLVIGANGATGRLILEELVAAKKYLPIAMVRDPEQEHELINIPQLYGKIQTVIADLEYPMEWIFEDVHHNSPPIITTTKKDDESSGSAQQHRHHHDIEVVLFAAGSKGKNVANVDLAGGIRAFSTAQKFPYVKRFIMLSATNVRPDSQSAIKHYHRAKWYADEFIRDGDTFAPTEERSSTSSSPLYWTIVCPSTLTNVDNDPEVIGKVDLGQEYWVDRENKNFAQETNGKGVYRPGAKSARRNVAKVMVAAIDNEKTFKKTFRLLDGEDEIEDAFNKL